MSRSERSALSLLRPHWLDARLSLSVSRAFRSSLLFGLRLWVSVCLALLVAFWLELDNPFWAGATAAVVCQRQLGASLRKGWFRMIGTIIGATMVVVLTAWFPQDRFAFLGFLALWGGICAVAATVFRNFASYSAALAGYTAAIVGADALGATGGPSSEVFMLAIWRASEICIGIVCAGIVLAATDLGAAERRLATSFGNLATEIVGRFTRMLAVAGSRLTEMQAERRELIGRVIALDPLIDQALGESTHLRYRSPILARAVHGLFRALDGWRGVAAHLRRLPHDAELQAAEAILSGIPPELRSASEMGSPARWFADPIPLRRACDYSVRNLLALPADTPSHRLLADETAKILAGISRALDALALLVDAPSRSHSRRRDIRLVVPDWLPALVNAARAFVAIVAAELFWVVTSWPDGASAIVFTAVVVLLLSPRGDLAFGGAVAITVGVTASVVCAAIIKFAVLPAFAAFAAFCIAMGLFLVPVGAATAQSRHPVVLGVLNGMTLGFVPLLAPTNEMSYDTAQFYNSALAIVIGCGIGALAFRLLPPLPPLLRARRLLALTLRDLRHLAIAPFPPLSEDWEDRTHGRLAAMPEQAEPLQRARLMAALSVGTEIIRLRQLAPRLGATEELNPALRELARGSSVMATTQLRQLEHRLASSAGPLTVIAHRARGRLLVISDALAEHGSFFDVGALP